MEQFKVLFASETTGPRIPINEPLLEKSSITPNNIHELLKSHDGEMRVRPGKGGGYWKIRSQSLGLYDVEDKQTTRSYGCIHAGNAITYLMETGHIFEVLLTDYNTICFRIKSSAPDVMYTRSCWS